MAKTSPNDWRVYILRCSDGSLYTGATNDPRRRLEQHSAGLGSRYTRSRLPVSLVYEEKAADRGSALRREAALKRLSRDAKLELIGSRAGRRKADTGRPKAEKPRARRADTPPAREVAAPRGRKLVTPRVRKAENARPPEKPQERARAVTVPAASVTVPPVYRAIVRKNERQAKGLYDVLVCGHAVPAATDNTFRKARPCPECRLRVQHLAEAHARDPEALTRPIPHGRAARD